VEEGGGGEREGGEEGGGSAAIATCSIRDPVLREGEFALLAGRTRRRSRSSAHAHPGHGEDSETRGDHPREVVRATTITGDNRTVTATTGMPMTAASSSRGDACQEDRPLAVNGEADGRVRFRAGSLRRRRRRLPRQSCEDIDGAGELSHASECSALSYVLARQIDDKVDYCRGLINARFDNSENLYRKDLLSHYGCVNAIEFSNQGDLLVSGESPRDGSIFHVASLRSLVNRETKRGLP